MQIRYFASIRQAIGKSEDLLNSDSDLEGLKTVGDLVSSLVKSGAAYEAAFADRERLRCAVNQEFADMETPICEGDEVAFFPPVTGG